MTEPNFSINFTARMLASEECEVGDALVYDTDEGLWVVATSANRTAARAGTQAIALTAYGGSVVGKVTYQSSGIVSAEFSGLADIGGSTRKLVRTSTAGRLERVDAYTDGDDIVGYAYADGRVALHLGVPWSLIAGTAASPSLPDYSVQYRDTDGTFGGAAHVSIASDGALELAADRAGGAAETGDERGAKGHTLKVRSYDDDRDVSVLTHFSGDRLAIGGLASTTTTEDVYELYLEAERIISSTIRNADGSAQYFVRLQSLLPSSGAFFALSGLVNLAFYGNASSSLTNAELFGAGSGVQYWGRAHTAPSTNPVSGYIGYVDPSTYHPMARMPNGDVFDLTSGGGGEGDFVTVTTAGAITADTATDGVRTIKFAPTHDPMAEGTATTLGGFVAPASGESKHVTIILAPGGTDDTVTLYNDSGDTAANGVLLSSGTDVVVTYPAIKTVTIAYDHNSSRWRDVGTA